MNPAVPIFLFINLAALMSLPRRYAVIPLLVASCYMPQTEFLKVGPFTFTVIRLLVLGGAIRALTKSERPSGGLNSIDKTVIAFGIWAVISSFFHEEVKEALVFRLGLVYNTLGIYFLIRTFCGTMEDFTGLLKVVAFMMVPVSLEMLNEMTSGYNFFSVFGGVEAQVTVRNDKLRAQGPFAHGILAGTVGAICLPMMVGLWKQHRMAAKVGTGACLLMVITCNSSGPIMTTLFGLMALWFWKYREFTRHLRVAAVVAFIVLYFTMESPPWYLLARIDLTGSSTGWHRAELIDSSIRHLGEWWITGTDYTRHWMPTGVTWNVNHTDITNHYLEYGVLAGLPLLLLFVRMLWLAMKYVGIYWRQFVDRSPGEAFMIWTVGATLFAHAATSLSVSYFDQSFVFLYLSIAIAGCLPACAQSVETEAEEEEFLVAGESVLK